MYKNFPFSLLTAYNICAQLRRETDRQLETDRDREGERALSSVEGFRLPFGRLLLRPSSAKYFRRSVETTQFLFCSLALLNLLLLHRRAI